MVKVRRLSNTEGDTITLMPLEESRIQFHKSDLLLARRLDIGRWEQVAVSDMRDEPDLYNVSQIHEAISLAPREKELLALTRNCPEMIEIVDDLDLMDLAKLVRDF
jgi:hypothetical protein